MNNKKIIIEKIKKVMALAENNPNENEAIAAALKAQKLMAEYHIEEKELGLEITERNIESVCCAVEGKTQKWKIRLGMVLAKNFRCKCYLYGKEVTFYGFSEDVQICREVFYAMYNIGVKLSDKKKREVRKQTGTAKNVRNTFCMGFVDGIKSELEKQCTALMIIVPKEVNDKFKIEIEQCSKKTSTRVAVKGSANIYYDGFNSGKEAIRQRSIE